MHALLTVDLNNVTEAQRVLFRDSLKAHHWIKHKLTTVWTASFSSNATRAGVLARAREDVSRAVAAAKIANYEVGVMISTDALVQWKAP